MELGVYVDRRGRERRRRKKEEKKKKRMELGWYVRR
jgi:hypothetical protein